jgi:mannose-6-phosphate isomerase-like protein (cupin superfamily)
MKITRSSIDSFGFRGLDIADYTSGLATSSSFAEITIPPGGVHPKTYSIRSDKYYYVVSGCIQFTVGNESFQLTAGDVCVILKNEQFSYRNDTQETSKMILVHTPSFDLESEMFEESQGE